MHSFSASLCSELARLSSAIYKRCAKKASPFGMPSDALCIMNYALYHRPQHVHYEYVCGEDDEVHPEAYAHEVRETVSSGAIDEHVCG